MALTIGRLVLFVSGGYAGTALYSNKDNLPVFLSSTLSGLSELLRSSGKSISNSNVEKQVEMLSQDMRALMLSGRGGTVVVSASPQGSLMTRLILIVVPGTGVYLWYKGFRFSDLQWVSRNSFQQAVQSMQGAQTKLDKFVTEFRESVQKRIADFQAHVNMKFGLVERQIDDKVGEVREGVAQAQTTLDGLDERVQRLEGKVDDTKASLQYTSRGIQLLCSVVAESVAGSSKSARDLQYFAQTNPTPAVLDGAAPAALPMLGEVVVGVLGCTAGAPVMVELERSSSPLGVVTPNQIMVAAIGSTTLHPTTRDVETANPPYPDSK